MKKILLLVLGLSFISQIVYSAPPTRSFTYTTGEKILPAEVTTNEDNVFNYLSTGVDTYADSSIVSADIADGTITTADIANETITTSDILDTTIVNADISASAAIALSKLATTPTIYSDTRFSVVSFTRDISSASGTQEVSTTFAPKAVIFIYNLNGSNTVMGIGIDDVTTPRAVFQTITTGNGSGDASFSLSFRDIGGAGNDHYGKITTMGTTSFTITWTKDASPTGTANIYALVFR